MIFVFSPPLGGGIQVYHPARDGTVSSAFCSSPSSVCRLALGYSSCMVDILLNTSFLDDMGDHSKSKIIPFLIPLYFVRARGFIWTFMSLTLFRRLGLMINLLIIFKACRKFLKICKRSVHKACSHLTFNITGL